MARAIWKGNVTFGLVNVPVVLYSAERRTDLQFRLLDSRNHARVRYERINEQTGEEVPWNEIVKAYEYDGGDYVVLSGEDFQRASVEATQTVEIEDFVDQDAIDYVYFDKPYYLVAGKKGEKGYVILREALKRAKKVGLAKVVIHTRQHLAALMAQDSALVLNLLRFQQELREKSEFDFPEGSLKDYKISSKEMDMAKQLIENMSTDWNPGQYHDEYRDALMSYIEKKARSGKVEEIPEEEEGERPTGVINIADLLKESVEKSGKGRKKSKGAAKKKSGSGRSSSSKSKSRSKSRKSASKGRKSA